MGWDIRGSKLKVSESIVHIQCQYSYQPIFKEALGKDITCYKGRVTIKNYKEIITAFNLIIERLKLECNVNFFTGNLSNRTKEDIASDFKEMIKHIKNREIRYLSIN